MTPRVAIVLSTGGSVLCRLLEVPSFRRCVVSVVADRPCAGIARSAALGIPTTVHPTTDGAEFSDALLAHFDDLGVDYGVLFYTRQLSGPLLERYRDRILNLHPSLLPAFKGLHALEDALSGGVRFAGTTVHLVDEELDTGKIVLQTVFPVDPSLPYAALRHRVFVQQCKSLLQVVAWIRAGRLLVTGSGVTVAGARYDDAEYAPALDDPEALALDAAPPVPSAAV